MINSREFRLWAHKIADWMADYYENIEKYPVKSQVQPGEIFRQLPEAAPAEGENMEQIMADFQRIILPGITHWQSPNFFAYFPANSSYPSVLGEMLTSALAAQCMMWETSPSAAELEERVMDWLRQMIGLPVFFTGVIQDSASSATLCAILSAREKYSDFKINQHGFKGYDHCKIYCSTEAHSSIEKAVRIAGFGRANLEKIPVDEQLRMQPEKLSKAIERDIANGQKPVCVVAALGTTGTVAFDPLQEIAQICRHCDIWLHVDAAYAGSALVLPEYRWMIEGIDGVDSFVFNPHKWMFTNFDCSAYFVRDKETLIRTFEILPEYLMTKSRGAVNDYRDWGVPLGRRFRALKLWFVLRDYGVKGIQAKIREHISMTQKLAQMIRQEPDFQIMAPQNLAVVCFRYRPAGVQDVNSLNEKLLQRLNTTGKLYLTHTKIRGEYTLRFVIGQTLVQIHHMLEAWERIKEISRQMQ